MFSTIHKLIPEKSEAMPKLSARQNIAVNTEKAHCIQYGFGGKVNEKTGEMSQGFACNLRDALPNASFIGFTSTPIEKTDANTRAVFGDYIAMSSTGSILLRQQHRGHRPVPLGDDPDLGSTIRQVGGQ